MSVRFDEGNVRVMGRAARGVRGIRLDEGDFVTGVAVVDDSRYLLTVTENGYGKLSPFDDFREMKNRGGRGVTCQNTEGKYGALAGIASVSEDDDIMLITNLGQLIRTPAAEIRKCSRSAGGVIIMRLSEGQFIANFTRISRDDDTADSDTAEPEIEQTERVEKADMPMISDEADVNEEE